MHRRPSRTASLACTLLAMSALGAAACAGTPLPEPPDELPKPDFASFAPPGDSVAPVNSPESTALIVSTSAGAVKPNTPVWIINLDTSDPAILVTADAQGAFNAPALSASVNDRVRVLSRTETQHSAPLDLSAVARDASTTSLLAVAALPDQSLSCLSVTPTATLSLRGSQGALRLENGCPVAVDLTRVALRFGDQGLTVSAPPARIDAGQSVTLTVDDSRGPSASERLEIVLIDARASDGREGRYAIDVFSALE